MAFGYGDNDTTSEQVNALNTQLLEASAKLFNLDEQQHQARLRFEQEEAQKKLQNAQSIYEKKVSIEQEFNKRVSKLNKETQEQIAKEKASHSNNLKQIEADTEKEYKIKLEAAKKNQRALTGKKKLSSAEIKALEEKTRQEVDIAKKEKEKQEKKNYSKTKAGKEEAKAAAKINKEASDAAAAELNKAFSGGTIKDKFSAIKGAFTSKDEDGNDTKDLAKGLSSSITALADYAATLKNSINAVAYSKSEIDTRLQGLSKEYANSAGSYWEKMGKDVTNIAGVSPFVKQQDIVDKIKEYVGKGIAYNVEQRAFLAVMSDKIANTFNAADGTLLKLVRIQQQDSTAARLGMESAITSFLNNMYETTEYLESVASTVRQNLYEAEALMSATDATAFEYQVQKWAGSMYSVGMSDNAVSKISEAIGQLASGDVSGISSGGASNLLVMAANNAGISISEALQEGLNDESVNNLMNSVVVYLQKIYDSTNGSKVLQQQYANVYGLTASDLKAAANLGTSTTTIAKSYLDYSGQIQQLNNMASTMYQRTSMGEMLSNASENMQYTMAANIANSPTLYSIYTIANLLKDTTGGIDFSLPTVMGTGMAAQTFNVADIMLAGTMGAGVLSGLAGMVSSGSGGGISGKGMLSALGIGNGITTVSRGNGEGLLTTSGATVSEGGYVANSSSGDIVNKSKTDTTDESSNTVEASSEEAEEVTNTTINENIVAIYSLLSDVVDGTSSLHVTQDNYGMTGIN